MPYLSKLWIICTVFSQVRASDFLHLKSSANQNLLSFDANIYQLIYFRSYNFLVETGSLFRNLGELFEDIRMKERKLVLNLCWYQCVLALRVHTVLTVKQCIRSGCSNWSTKNNSYKCIQLVIKPTDLIAVRSAACWETAAA